MSVCYDIEAVFKNGRAYQGRIEKLSPKLCALFFNPKRCQKARIVRVVLPGFGLESRALLLQYGFASESALGRGAGYWINLMEANLVEGVELKELVI